jgi:hypothetical protein
MLGFFVGFDAAGGGFGAVFLLDLQPVGLTRE